jgi:formylglycine-generating enzyme required for sulfatase activity
MPYVIRLHRLDASSVPFVKVVSALISNLNAAGLNSTSREVGPDATESDATESREPSDRGPTMTSFPQVGLVTNREYNAFIQTSDYRPSQKWTTSRSANSDPDSAVTNITWDDAVAYCEWNNGRLPELNSGATDSVSDTKFDTQPTFGEWRNAGSVHSKQVWVSSRDDLMSVMDRTACAANVGFRCVPARPPLPNLWVRCPAGQFEIGTDLAHFSGLAAVHQVPRHIAQPILNRNSIRQFVGEFAISKYCVTNEEYFQFTTASGKPWPSYWSATWLRRTSRPFPTDFAGRPVTCISGEDARTYCMWCKGRLPTWFEWERAASGVTRTPYPWGRDYSSNLCNSVETGLGTLAHADVFQTGDTSDGVRQMSGNVAEWTVGPNGKYEIRGGSYLVHCEIWGLAYAFRERLPNFRAIDVGFRIVSTTCHVSG